jgi:hypothetical protein
MENWLDNILSPNSTNQKICMSLLKDKTVLEVTIVKDLPKKVADK